MGRFGALPEVLSVPYNGLLCCARLGSASSTTVSIVYLSIYPSGLGFWEGLGWASLD